jgi:hypothetical protein
MFNQIKARLDLLVSNGTPTDKAVGMVRRMVMQDSDLSEEVISEAVNIASRYTFRSAIRRVRSKICNNARAEASEKLKEKAAGLMEFRLPYGGLLKNATGKECIESAEFYHKIAATNKRRGDFLRAVGLAAGDKVVGKALSENQVKKLYAETGEGDE